MLASIGDDQFGQLAGQFLEPGKTRQRLLEQRQLIVGDVARVILALLPTLELVVQRRLRGSIGEGAAAELATGPS